MGVVIGTEPTGRWSRPVLRLLSLLVFAAIALTLLWVLAHREPLVEDWTLDRLIRAVWDGEVGTLTISGERVIAETASGARRQVGDLAGTSIIDLLRARGIPEELLSGITVVSVQPRGPIPWLLRWFFSLPIVILVLGLGGALVSRNLLVRKRFVLFIMAPALKRWRALTHRRLCAMWTWANVAQAGACANGASSTVRRI
jgi:hypothetical protein